MDNTINKEQDSITISIKAYNKLLRDQDFLFCLEAAGVDNWQGIDDAIDIFNKGKYAHVE